MADARDAAKKKKAVEKKGPVKAAAKPAAKPAAKVEAKAAPAKSGKK
jgi:hypothetical protein